MKVNAKVSILIPICNVEKYLPQCLESVVSQTLKEIEIICIDDGSTDSSPQIIQKYAERDSRIVVISKKNSGYGDSMNRGLKKAHGKYVGIVESDDFVEPEFFEDLYYLAEKNHADVARSDYFFFKKGKDTKAKTVREEELSGIVNPETDPWVFRKAPAIWASIYRRDFLLENDIWFLPTPGASYQDAGFNFKVLASTNKIVFTDIAYLHYRQDNESSSVNSPGKVFCVHDEYDEVERFLTERGKLDQFGETMEVVRYESYYWNLLRLSSKLGRQFVPTFKKDFRKAEEAQLMEKSNDAGDTKQSKEGNYQLCLYTKQRKTYEMIMHSPAFLSVMLVRLPVKIKKICHVPKQIIKKIRPTYRKQLDIINEANRLMNRSRILFNRIELLESKLKDKEQKSNEKS